jgi:hypothetical protein
LQITFDKSIFSISDSFKREASFGREVLTRSFLPVEEEQRLIKRPIL